MYMDVTGEPGASGRAPLLPCSYRSRLPPQTTGPTQVLYPVTRMKPNLAGVTAAESRCGDGRAGHCKRYGAGTEDRLSITYGCPKTILAESVQRTNEKRRYFLGGDGGDNFVLMRQTGERLAPIKVITLIGWPTFLCTHSPQAMGSP